MFTGWLSYGGVEIVNEARVAAYAESLGIPGALCEECPTLRTSFGHEPYTTPAADNAPWFDTNIPESGQVAGFQIASISGLGDTATRRVDELSRDGGIVGPRRRVSRNLQITFRAIASSECALNYAAAWLSRVLRGKDCSPVSNIYSASTTCGSETFCMLTCCPAVPADINTYLTSLYRVGLTEGPSVTGKQSSLESGDTCGLALCEIDVVFTAGDPGWYSQAVNIVNTPLAPFYVGTTDPFTPYEITELCDPLNAMPDAVRCTPITPPDCVTTSIPLTSSPPIPCIGIPDPRTTYTQFNHYSIPINTSGITQWFDLIPRIQYLPGQMSPNNNSANPQTIQYFEGPIAFQLRRVTPTSPCGTQADPCDVCIEIFAPSWSRWTPGVIDWIERKAFRLDPATGLCPFPIYTRGLGPFNWPTLLCGSQMCLDIYITTDSDARSGSVTLDVMRRQDAQC